MCSSYYLLARAVFGRGLGRTLECLGAKTSRLLPLSTSEIPDFMIEPPPSFF